MVELATEGWEQERARLLRTNISELGLSIAGTPLQGLVERLYAELDAVGLRFEPKVYLAEEWACPDGVPIIGIPFYLADPRLMRIEDEMMDGVEAESDEDILAHLCMAVRADHRARDRAEHTGSGPTE